MNSVKILHCADIHIGAAVSFLGTRAQSRQAEILLTFESIIKEAKKSAVDIILIAGDLFHSNNISKSFIDRAFDCFATIPQIKVVVACGNHDPFNADSPFKSHRLDNLFVLDTNDSFVEFTELKTRVYGKSFKEIYSKGEACFSLKPDGNFINLMCIHGELGADQGSNYNAISSSFIENSGMDYIALGHIHKRTEIQKIANTYFAYCGCPEGQGFDELDNKGVYIGTVSKHDCNLQFLPIAKRIHITENIDISGLYTSADIAEHILAVLNKKHGNAYRENLYKIALIGQLEEWVSISLPEITSRLNDELYFAKLKDKTELKIDLEQLSKEQSLKGIFVKNMLKRIENANECDLPRLKHALSIGLKAFNTEVTYDED